MDKKFTETEVFYLNIAKQAIKEIRREEKDNQRKAALHNTKLLLKRYLDIRDSIKLAKCHFMVSEEEIILKSIFRSRAVSKLLLNHIDACMDSLESKHQGKAKILKLMYCNEQYRTLTYFEKIASIAEQSHNLVGVIASERTVERWISDMTVELSTILFGADGLRLLLI